MSTPTPYDEAVRRNLAHMGTPASDWQAVPIATMVNDGQNPPWPSFEYPSGYTPAPSLFKITGQDANCELCGHPIKICFALQNDSKRWLLTVGSECVTHFGEGKSGKELASEKAKADKRQALRSARRWRCKIVEAIGLTRDLSNPETRERLNWLHRAEYMLGKLLRGYYADEETFLRHGKMIIHKAATDAEVSGWYRARKAKCDKWIAEFIRIS